MSGTVNIARDLWDDPTFKDTEMSQREAWIWLIAEASWKARTRRVGTVEIDLKRGQLAASTRFMAKAWMWSEPRVRRYLDMLENRRMIARVTDAGVTVITICKYDDYQNAPRVGDAAATHQPTQDRRTTDANENKGEIRGKEEREDTDVSLSTSIDQKPPPANDISQAVTRYNAAAGRAGWPQVQKLTHTRSRLIRARLAECGGLEGWEVALRRAFDSDFCRGRTAKPWTGFSFDWLVKAANFTKLMEGNYDNRSGAGQPADRSQNRADPAIEQISRLAGLSGGGHA